jgi:tetratricopeptide (TPR) repeat protein
VTSKPHSHVEPFWNRLPQIAVYPMQPKALAAILSATGFVVVLGFLSGLLALIVQVITLASIYRYGSGVLQATADGQTEAPEVAFGVSDSQGWMQLRLIIFFIFIGIVAVYLLPPVLSVAVILGLCIGIPAATILLAIEESFWDAVNPARWVQIISRIGWPYIAVVLLCIVFWISEANLQEMLVRYLPRFVAGVLNFFVMFYVAIMGFHLMGYMVYQYADELGYSAQSSTEPLKKRIDPDQELLDRSEALVQDGKLEQAKSLLGGHLRAQGGSAVMHERYRLLLTTLNDREGLLAHGKQQLSIWLAQDKMQEAMKLYLDSRALDPQFQPQQAEEVFQMASFTSHSNPKLALSILSGIQRHFPKHRDNVKSLFLAARLLHETQAQSEPSKRLLEEILRLHPTNALAPEIKSYLAAIP